MTMHMGCNIDRIGVCVAAAATPATAPTVAQWVASTQADHTNGAPASIAAIGGLVMTALVASAALVLV